jgi:5'-nucleotidase
MSCRVTVKNYLALGGDGFAVLKQAIEARFCVYDVDALYGYFQARSPLAPVSANRIARSNRNELQLDRALSEWRTTT